MTRLAVTLCLAALAAALLIVAYIGDQEPTAIPTRPVPAWRQPGPAAVTPPPGVSWCDDSACDQTR